MTLLSDPELLARLVAVDSTSHLSNLPLAGALADYVARPGVRIELLPSPDGGKANLLVRTGNEAVLAFYEELGYARGSSVPIEKWLDPSKRGGA